jgi:hypothetical protein
MARTLTDILFSGRGPMIPPQATAGARPPVPAPPAASLPYGRTPPPPDFWRGYGMPASYPDVGPPRDLGPQFNPLEALDPVIASPGQWPMPPGPMLAPEETAPFGGPSPYLNRSLMPPRRDLLAFLQALGIRLPRGVPAPQPTVSRSFQTEPRREG